MLCLVTVRLICLQLRGGCSLSVTFLVLSRPSHMWWRSSPPSQWQLIRGTQTQTWELTIQLTIPPQIKTMIYYSRNNFSRPRPRWAVRGLKVVIIILKYRPGGWSDDPSDKLWDISLSNDKLGGSWLCPASPAQIMILITLYWPHQLLLDLHWPAGPPCPRLSQIRPWSDEYNSPFIGEYLQYSQFRPRPHFWDIFFGVS